MADLTAIILTMNESSNIGDCLRSIKGFIKRAVVVDSGSADNTIVIARDLGADIYEHKFETHARQFNWALDNINIDTKWTLRLDADERLTPGLCEELEYLMKSHQDSDVNGITMEAWFYFLGKCIKHGGRKKRKLMIFKTGLGRVEDRKMDEHTVLLKGHSVATRERFLHYDFRNLDYFISKLNWYATREMHDYLAWKQGASVAIQTDKKIQQTRKKKFGLYYKAPMFWRSRWLFIYNYYFRLGFLDGREGYIYHFFQCYWYRYLVDAKIYEYETTGAVMEELMALGETASTRVNI